MSWSKLKKRRTSQTVSLLHLIPEKMSLFLFLLIFLMKERMRKKISRWCVWKKIASTFILGDRNPMNGLWTLGPLLIVLWRMLWGTVLNFHQGKEVDKRNCWKGNLYCQGGRIIKRRWHTKWKKVSNSWKRIKKK